MNLTKSHTCSANQYTALRHQNRNDSLPRPFPRCRLITGPITLVCLKSISKNFQPLTTVAAHVSDLGNERIIRVRIGEHRADGQEHWASQRVKEECMAVTYPWRW